MTNKEFNKSKEEKRQMFFDMQEHPDRYTDEQVERLLADEDVKDFFHDMAMVRMAMKKGSPKKVNVDEAWKKDDLKVVAFLNKHNTKNRLDNRIENVTGKDLIEKPTAIESVGSADNAVEVARYNAAGQRINGKQKGLNIVKLSNGTTLKVVVK